LERVKNKCQISQEAQQKSMKKKQSLVILKFLQTKSKVTSNFSSVTVFSLHLIKVPLKPGFGLSNWMSIVRKGKNVSGISPRRPVTEDELAQHKSRQLIIKLS